ncbi:MAG: tRNA (guanosine(46)-N7)-methyltransferase TrmB [Chitinophagaceae bacterium]
MAQKKLIRFKGIRSFANVLEYPQNMKRQWNNFFKNNNSIVLELACGKGEYAVELGKMHPQKNFIGVDVKGNRIWKGAKTALDADLKNVAFLRTQIEMIANYFDRNEVSEIWIIFPDPQLRFSKMKKRLTHPRFLRLYQQILKPNGSIHLKTDSSELYHFTKKLIHFYQLNLIDDINDVVNSNKLNNELKIKTHYENLNISQSDKIFYLQFRINKDLPLEKDAQLKKLFYEEQVK